MTRVLLALLFICVSHITLAKEVAPVVSTISQHLAKVKVALATGNGLGSGVIVADNKVVTNCHVVADALSVKVMINDAEVNVTGFIPDWQHDLCILVVDHLKAPAATLGDSARLHYEQPLFALGFAGDTKTPHVSYGFVKGLYPMDDSVIVRASNTFNVGDSGGGVFDTAGHLVAIIDVKSPGKKPNYYNLSVAWIKNLMQQPVQQVENMQKGESPFWAKTRENWPYFMRVVHPLKTKNWKKLSKLADQWASAEPKAIEATYYQGLAAFKLHHLKEARGYLTRVVHQNAMHTEAVYLLGLVNKQNGRAMKAKQLLAMLGTTKVTKAESVQ
jgi:serine protease Do